MQPTTVQGIMASGCWARWPRDSCLTERNVLEKWSESSRLSMLIMNDVCCATKSQFRVRTDRTVCLALLQADSTVCSVHYVCNVCTSVVASTEQRGTEHATAVGLLSNLVQ